MTSINVDEWRKALADAGYQDGVHDEEALTSAEFAAMMNMPRQTAASRLETLVETGRATRTFKYGVNSYGRRIQYRAYRLVT